VSYALTKVVKTYYWEKKPNFGDVLTSFILQRFINLESEWAAPENAELVVVGSTLEQLPKDWNGVIAGAGKLHEKTNLNFPNATILALRGPLTAKGLKGNFVLADPGLLADELVQIEDKQYDLGIIPHWTDNKLEHDPRFTKYNPKIIRVGNDPLEVISEIGRCKKIVSSSLHGIILADAFAIPRRIELAPRMITHAHQEGGIFKWLDYSASIRMKFEDGKTQEVDHNVVVDLESELFDVMAEVKRIFT
jgi:pyruvyltransferase